MPEPENSPSLVERLTSTVEGAVAGRDPDGECDECGASEGSVTHIKDWPGDADEKRLCRSCYNSPGVWPDG